MALPPPFQGSPGSTEKAVDTLSLKPSRRDLQGPRVERQRILIHNGIRRWTPISVTPDGVIIDGQHAVQAAAEEGVSVEV